MTIGLRTCAVDPPSHLDYLRKAQDKGEGEVSASMIGGSIGWPPTSVGMVA